MNLLSRALLILALVVPGAVLAAAGASAQAVTCTIEEQKKTGTCPVTSTSPAPPRPVPGHGGGAPGGGGSRAPFVQTRYELVCTNDSGGLTGAACDTGVSICGLFGGNPDGAKAYWVYTRLYDPSLPESRQAPFVRQGFECLAPNEVPTGPTVEDAAAAVQRDFAKFVVVTGRTRVDPGARTLINVETIFSTDKVGPEPLPDVPPVLGFQIAITVTPETYTWHFGDGTQLTTTTPGVPREKVVTHRYASAGSVRPYVEIEWSGTFTVNGGPVRAVQGTARTQGPSTPLDVLTARSELVHG